MSVKSEKNIEVVKQDVFAEIVKHFRVGLVRPFYIKNYIETNNHSEATKRTLEMVNGNMGDNAPEIGKSVVYRLRKRIDRLKPKELRELLEETISEISSMGNDLISIESRPDSRLERFVLDLVVSKLSLELPNNFLPKDVRGEISEAVYKNLVRDIKNSPGEYFLDSGGSKFSGSINYERARGVKEESIKEVLKKYMKNDDDIQKVIKNKYVDSLKSRLLVGVHFFIFSLFQIAVFLFYLSRYESSLEPVLEPVLTFPFHILSGLLIAFFISISPILDCFKHKSPFNNFFFRLLLPICGLIFILMYGYLVEIPLNWEQFNKICGISLTLLCLSVIFSALLSWFVTKFNYKRPRLNQFLLIIFLFVLLLFIYFVNFNWLKYDFLFKFFDTALFPVLGFFMIGTILLLPLFPIFMILVHLEDINRIEAEKLQAKYFSSF